MDLSKLPKLSKTPVASNDPFSIDDRPQRPARRYEDEDGPLGFLDIFLAIGMGALFMFLGMDYGKHLAGKDPYPMQTSAAPEKTGRVWSEGSAKAGQEVLPDELLEPHKSAYAKREQDRQALYVQEQKSRQMSLVSVSSLFLLGAGLAVAGIVGIVGHLASLPIRIRVSGAMLGVLATVAGMGYAVWACASMLGNGITPPMTLVAILVAGLSLFMQAAAVRSLLGPALPATFADQAGSRFAGEPIAARPVAATQSADRIVHHRFAHQTLRKAVFYNPQAAIGMLQGPGGGKYLRDLWEATCHTAGADPQMVVPTGLESEMTQVGPYSAAVVTLPAARAAGEAQFVGIVLRSYARDDGATIERTPLVLYYTLEAMGTSDSVGVLCEWQAGDHVKFAEVLATDYRAFREAMWAKVQTRQASEDR